MWEESLNRITPATWANTVRHTETLVREWSTVLENPACAYLVLMKHINKANITFVANKYGVVINWTVFNSLSAVFTNAS
jgi:hypothetical protein